MDFLFSTSDVKHSGGGIHSPLYVGFVSGVLPETDTLLVDSFHKGVSTEYARKTDCGQGVARRAIIGLSQTDFV